MPLIRSALALLALGCSDPTAVGMDYAADAPVTVSAERSAKSSFSITGAAGTVYVRLVRPGPGGAEPVHAFMRRMFAAADSARARHLVIDLRGVSGTDARLVVPLIRGIVTRERFARTGGLYVVVGEESFSPAQAAATLLQRYANPLFVADPPAR